MERRKLRRANIFSKPELIATAPNKLGHGMYQNYCVLKSLSTIISMLDLFQQIFKKQNILHSDNGPIMKSDLLRETNKKMKIKRSLNRPYVSNDNPFSEANFKTLKHSPGYPNRFQSIEEADAFLNIFYKWYNEEHFHSGIKCLTPVDVHYGTQIQTIEMRKIVLNKAKKKNPNRFLGSQSTPCIFNEPVYINKPINNVS